MYPANRVRQRYMFLPEDGDLEAPVDIRGKWKLRSISNRRNRYSPRGPSSQMCRANHSQLCTIAASRSRGFVIPWPNPL